MDTPEPETQESDESDHPRGTLLIAGLFLVALAVAWSLMYMMMLSRS